MGTNPPILVPTDPAVLGYLAAIFDGEGNVGISALKPHDRSKSVSHYCYVQVTNTSTELMEWLLRQVGGAVSSTGPRNERCREGFVWKLHGRNAKAFLEAIQPFVVVKRAQVVLALEFLGLGSGRRFGTRTPAALVERREQLRLQMIELNRKGPRSAEGLVRGEGRVVELRVAGENRYGT